MESNKLFLGCTLECYIVVALESFIVQAGSGTITTCVLYVPDGVNFCSLRIVETKDCLITTNEVWCGGR